MSRRPSDENDLDSLFKEVNYTLASEITDNVIIAKVDNAIIKKDRHMRDILVLHLKTKEYGKVVVSYSPQFAKMLKDRLTELNISTLNDFIGSCFEFEKVKSMKIREDYTDPYPRFLPRKKVVCKDL